MKKLINKIFRSNRIFSNAIIVFCVGYMAVYLQECLFVSGAAELARVAGAFFGGELLLICMAYRFGQRKKKTVEPEENV